MNTLSSSEYENIAITALKAWPNSVETNREVSDYLTKLLDVPGHLFFTPSSIQYLLDEMLSDQKCTEAVLSTTVQLAIYLETINFDKKERTESGKDLLINTIASGVSGAFLASLDKRSDGVIAILPDQIQLNVAHEESDISAMLHANFWLVTLWMLRVQMESTFNTIMHGS